MWLSSLKMGTKVNSHWAIIALALLVSVSGCRPKNFDEELKNAEARFSLGENDAALDSYRNLLKHFPDDPRAPGISFRIAEIYENTFGDEELAAAEYGNVTKNYPFSEAARLSLFRHAHLMEKRSSFDYAIEDYAALLKYFPDSPDKYRVRLLLAGAYLAQRNFPQARTELSPLIEDKDTPKEVREEAVFTMAESFFLEDKPNEAVFFYQEFLRLFPQSHLAPEAKLHMATCVEEMGYLGAARDITKEAMRDYPNKDVVKKRLESIDNRGKK